MAERILREKLKLKSCEGIDVSSAALYDMEEKPADPRAVEILDRKGFDGRGHKSRLLAEDMVVSADKILVMEGVHKDIIINKYNHASGKVYLLKSFSKDYNEWDEDIKDPYGRPDYYYRLCFAEICMAIEGFIEKCI